MATRVQTHAGNIATVAGYQEVGERTLLASARRGQKSAFGELCEPHMQKILQTAYRITKNREDAEDAQQDAFLLAFVHINDFDGRSRFSTWLTRIAINSALMILRKKRSSPEILNGHFLDFDDLVELLGATFSGQAHRPTDFLHRLPPRSVFYGESGQ